MRVPSEVLHRYCLAVLRVGGVRDDVAAAVADGLIQTSVRGVDSFEGDGLSRADERGGGDGGNVRVGGGVARA